MDKLKQLVQFLHTRGIALPLIRYKGEGSFSATVFWISTTLVLVGFLVNFYVFLDYTYIKKIEKINYFPMTELLAWFGTTCVPYLMRNTGGKNEQDK